MKVDIWEQDLLPSWPMVAVAYIRPSASGPGALRSMAAQRRAVRQVADKLGFDLLVWYEDRRVEQGRGPALQRLLTDVARPGRGFDWVLVHDGECLGWDFADADGFVMVVDFREVSLFLCDNPHADEDRRYGILLKSSTTLPAGCNCEGGPACAAAKGLVGAAGCAPLVCWACGSVPRRHILESLLAYYDAGCTTVLVRGFDPCRTPLTTAGSSSRCSAKKRLPVRWPFNRRDRRLPWALRTPWRLRTGP